MCTIIIKDLPVAPLGLFAASQLNANNKATQSNSGARAKQEVEIGA